MAAHDPAAIQRIHDELHRHLPSEPALRARALESLLIEKGLVDSETVDAWVDTYAEEIGPKRGARIVAHAWHDPDFKRRLLADGARTIRAFGFEALSGRHLQVVENTDRVHNLVVCTLCSCYPVTILGVPPNWYKTAAYRARAVREPRAVLAEFGVALSAETEVRVWDSTSERRYFVLPQRPAGTADWNEARLAGLVTRNAMIGTQRDLDPSQPIR